ncbi:MAG: hypothetical protein IJR63_00360 [Synergistaceae bacterium]|nr:hypothetical protein [Synergistaceae bacterium]
MPFSDYWPGDGREKSDTQKFWFQLLHDVLGVHDPLQFIDFEKTVDLEHKSYIDAFIPLTGTIIEQKSSDIDLSKPIPQSDGSSLTPFQQAKRYRDGLPASQQGRFIIVSNFREIHIHDMETPKAPPRIIPVHDIEREKNNLAVIITREMTLSREERISIQAGLLAEKLRDELLKRYKSVNDSSRRSLNIFCVRIVFLLYAEDSGLFRKSQFHDYLKARSSMARLALSELFRVLNTKKNERDPYLEADIDAFPYVNGGLFSDGNIEIPNIEGEPLRIILEDMSEGFDWSEINPTIFGAIFESILSDRKNKGKSRNDRKIGGMHYTTTQNIHKAIDFLFMNGLKSELKDAGRNPAKLKALLKKLTALKFFDPACGSGNFLTETYMSLCRIEHEIIRILEPEQQGTFTFLQVSIEQFYGIEINPFAAAVARTALWIAEAQMFLKANPGANPGDALFPLSTSANILEANALRTSWPDFLPPSENTYIIGNPPFIGYSSQNADQKRDMLSVYVNESGIPYTTAGKTDYVAAWYYKASQYMAGTKAKAAFVSTNSICQGEQVAYVWEPLLDLFGIHIDFAHTAFIWESESLEEAHVHIVVIGFSVHDEGKARLLIYPDGSTKTVSNISPYLVEGRNIFVRSATKSLTPNVPAMMGGNRPADGGHLLLTPEERAELLEKCPKAERWIKRYMMGREFIHNEERYCLWLVDATPHDLASMPPVMERIRMCKEARLAGAPDRQKLANTSWLFRDTLNPKRYLAIPYTSSERRLYIPMGFLDDSVVPGDGLRIIPDADLYTFGVLTSRVHMAWMRRVAGRLEVDYRYSAQVVYNPFPWPDPSRLPLSMGGERQQVPNDEGGFREIITQTARGILEARALSPESTYAELYNDLVMPPALRAAHERNDEAVCRAYGFDAGMGEDEIAGALMEMYEGIAGSGAKLKVRKRSKV